MNYEKRLEKFVKKYAACDVSPDPDRTYAYGKALIGDFIKNASNLDKCSYLEAENLFNNKSYDILKFNLISGLSKELIHSNFGERIIVKNGLFISYLSENNKVKSLELIKGIENVPKDCQIFVMTPPIDLLEKSLERALDDCIKEMFH